MVISVHGKIGAGKDEVGSIIQYLTSSTYRLGLTYDYFKLLEHPQSKTPFEIKKFADKLKDTICLWLSCTREQLEDREFKEKELGPEWWYYQVQDGNKNTWSRLIPYVGADHKFNRGQCKLIKLTPRKLLQILGTEAGRDIIHPDIWVNLLFNEYKPKDVYPKFRRVHENETIPDNIILSQSPKWIITDNRFPNEIARVKKAEGITIKIVRPINLRFPKAWKDFDIATDKLYPRTEENFLNFLSISNYEPYRKLYISLTHYSEKALDNYDKFDYVVKNDGSIEDLINKIKNILTEIKII